MYNFEAWHGDHCVYNGGSKKSMEYEVYHYLEFNEVEEREIDYYVNGDKQR